MEYQHNHTTHRNDPACYASSARAYEPRHYTQIRAASQRLLAALLASHPSLVAREVNTTKCNPVGA